VLENLNNEDAVVIKNQIQQYLSILSCDLVESVRRIQ